MNFPLLKTALMFGMIYCTLPVAFAQDKGKSEWSATVGIYPVEDIVTTTYIAPVGIRFGKDFGGFMEMGYGYKGMLNAGLSLRF